MYGFGPLIVVMGALGGALWKFTHTKSHYILDGRHPFEVVAGVTVGAVGLGGFLLHFWVSRWWFGWLDKHYPGCADAYREDVMDKEAIKAPKWMSRRAYELVNRWPVIKEICGQSYITINRGSGIVLAPPIEELVRWLPLVIADKLPLIGLGLLGLTNLMWSIGHIGRQVRPRTWWVRATHLWLLSWTYAATMVAGFVLTQNAWAAFVGGVMVHMMHNGLWTLVPQYRAKYIRKSLKNDAPDRRY